MREQHDFRGYLAIKHLAKSLKRRIPDLLALHRKNDPFYAGSPGQREKAAWFATLWERFGYTTGVHLRRVHYRIVVHENPILKVGGLPYENTESDWNYLCEAGKVARYLRLVRPDAFEDHRNPEPQVSPMISLASEEKIPRCDLSELGRWSLPQIPTLLGVEDAFALPAPLVSGYSYSAHDQPYALELWIEKSTENEVLLPLCQSLDMTFVTSVGFQSITNVIRLLQQRVVPSQKPTRIFYVSDFDPAGDEMPVAVARQVEFWLQEYAPATDIKLTPLAVTKEQVMTYRLPRKPIRDSDGRKAHFEERYGEGAVELDALEALYPGTLVQLVRDAVAPYRDLTLAHHCWAQEQAVRAQISAAWEEVIAPYVEELEAVQGRVRSICAPYQDILEQLNTRLQAELAPVRERLHAIRQAIQEDSEQFTVDLPPRVLPATERPDERHWLFDAERDYMTQLAMYKARKNGSNQV